MLNLQCLENNFFGTITIERMGIISWDATLYIIDKGTEALKSQRHRHVHTSLCAFIIKHKFIKVPN